MLISLCTQSLSLQCQYMCLCPQLLIKSAGLYLSTASPPSLRQTLGMQSWSAASSAHKAPAPGKNEQGGGAEGTNLYQSDHTEGCNSSLLERVGNEHLSVCHQQWSTHIPNGNLQPLQGWEKPTGPISFVGKPNALESSPSFVFFLNHNCCSIFPLQDSHFHILRVEA